MAAATIDDVASREDPPPSFWAVNLAIAKRGRVLAALILLGVLILQAASGGEGSGRFRNAVFDFYQRLIPRVLDQLPDEVDNFPILIVDIDEETLTKHGQWPWPRTLLARLVERVAALGPLAIGLDIILVEPDRMSPGEFLSQYPGLSPEIEKSLADLPSNDAVFAQTIGELPVIVARAALPVTPPNAKTRSVDNTLIQLEGPSPVSQLTTFEHQLLNVPVISKAAHGHGYLNGPPDPDGTLRRMPVVLSVGNKIVPSMGLELLRVAFGANWTTVVGDANGFVKARIGELDIPADASGKVILHFSPSDPRRRISAAKVLSGELAPDILAGRVALIGVTALGLTDAPATPVTPRMDGVEIQAQSFENMLFGAGLIRPDYAWRAEMGAVLLAGLFLIALMPRLGPVIGALPFVAMVAVLIGVGYGAFLTSNLLLDPSLPILAATLVFGSLLLSRLLETDRNRKIADANLRRERIENARMAGELNAAREIQMGILPDIASIPDIPSNIDAHAFLEPAKEVGGDLYDLFMIDDHRMFFIVGDVSGKGVPAALFMALSKALCKNAAFRDMKSVAELMNNSNIEISRENPAFLFVTAIAGVIDTKTGEMEFCNAGHDAPYLCREGEAPRPLESVGGPPICVIEDFDYPLERVQLQPGDALLLFTDGVNEAMNRNKEMYGFKRLLAYLESTAIGPTAHSMVDGLYRDIQNFVGGEDPWDDITIMTIRYLGPR